MIKLVDRDQSLEAVATAVMRIWEEPEHLAKYVVACDPSGGGAHPTAVRVWRYFPRRLVAECHGKFPSELLLAKTLSNLGLWYNEAVINIEIYRFGRECRSHLLIGHPLVNLLPYRNLYRMPSSQSLRLGLMERCDGPICWESTSQTRQILISAAREPILYAFNHLDEPVFPDDSGLDEYMNFVHTKSGPQAAPGANDDRVIADALAWVTFKQDFLWRDTYHPEENLPPREYRTSEVGGLIWDVEASIRNALASQEEERYEW